MSLVTSNIFFYNKEKNEFNKIITTSKLVVCKNYMKNIKMMNIKQILSMIDWNMPIETQSKGIKLARSIDTIVPFIQPLTPEHNKNVWENCAIIIAEKSDEIIKPHLVQLLEWLQDMNWPGAFCILSRLNNYTDDKSIQNAIKICLKKSQQTNNKIWESNLLEIKKSH